MADYEKLLEEKTWKNQVDTIGERVFYTLEAGFGETSQSRSIEVTQRPGDAEMIRKKQTKLLALLVQHLHETGAVDDETLDRMLFETTR